MAWHREARGLRVILGIMGVFWGILWYSWVNVWTGDGVPTEFTKVVFIENKSLLSYPQKAQNLNI
jgi:hypothetical protein